MLKIWAIPAIPRFGFNIIHVREATETYRQTEEADFSGRLSTRTNDPTVEALHIAFTRRRSASARSCLIRP